MNARAFVSTEEKRAIEGAIADAERECSAEIICAVATESGRYDRAEAVAGLFTALVGLWVVNAILAGPVNSAGSWEAASVPFLWQVAGVVAGFIVGNVAAAAVHPLRRLLVGKREMVAEVARAASHVFHQRRLASTHLRGGVLVYISLFERRVVILADEGAKAALGNEGINELRDLAVEKLRQGNRAGTLLDTVKNVGTHLAGAFSDEKSPESELPNDLLLLHPRP